jgi:hypothetical protein
VKSKSVGSTKAVTQHSESHLGRIGLSKMPASKHHLRAYGVEQ